MHEMWRRYRARSLALLIAAVSVGLVGALGLTVAQASDNTKTTLFTTSVEADWNDGSIHLSVAASVSDGDAAAPGVVSLHFGDTLGDFCSGVGSLGGADAVGYLTVDSKADTARLVVDIVLEGACPAGLPDPFMLHLDLTWTSTGIISTSHSRLHSTTGSFRFKNSTKTVIHSATVAGALPGGLDVVADLVFADMSFSTSRTAFSSH